MNMNRSTLVAMLGAYLLEEEDIGAYDRVTFYADGTAELEQSGRTFRLGFQDATQEEMKALGVPSLLVKRRGRSLVAYVSGRPIWNS